MSNDRECRELLDKAQAELLREREQNDRLKNLLHYDSNTGLLRRHLLIRRMHFLTDNTRERFAYGIVRLDRNYQRIRRSRDRLKVLLYVTAERLKSVMGKGNVYQSDREDEFHFILQLKSGMQEMSRKVIRLMDVVQEFHNPPAADISFGCNVGVAIYPEHGTTIDEIENNAEIALDLHREVGWSNFLYSPETGSIHHENNALEILLRQCILDEFSGFHVEYQPLVDIRGNLLGCEALMRWDAREYGAISPARFIPLAERSGPIIHLGKWILYQVLNQIKTWRESWRSSFFVSVNLSFVQLEQPDCAETIKNALNAFALTGQELYLEITESMAIEQIEMVRHNLFAFQKMGIQIMLDDFGTGYSSLALLNTLPVNTLKIAKEITDGIPSNPQSNEIIRAIMSISRSFGLTVTAEGIESEEQYMSLVEKGVEFFQGYFFSKPLSPDAFQERYLKKQ